MRTLLPLLVLGAFVPGCRNSCQTLCVHMAKYADECGYPVSEAEFQACLDEQAGANSRDDRATCREYGGTEALRAQWTCDDMAIYWESSGATEDPGTGS